MLRGADESFAHLESIWGDLWGEGGPGEDEKLHSLQLHLTALGSWWSKGTTRPFRTKRKMLNS